MSYLSHRNHAVYSKENHSSRDHLAKASVVEIQIFCDHPKRSEERMGEMNICDGPYLPGASTPSPIYRERGILHKEALCETWEVR